ncbi:hypothetical protein BDF20DRAFT_991214 [Mycotypha africana]|uniref:uncharacterized protein n=1 Tax=Mycotypha africana TaxID=64632 RepID=UPI0023019DA1|nr:uncharacterized protein BDF20DRAFT_991214 [Mycotypha africana]KAI8968252.1 hypothetical protein BDF20DRAFT_991214 [Mycotypha africana]
MDSSDFPTLQEANSTHNDNKNENDKNQNSTLGSSWAQVAKEDTTTSSTLTTDNRQPDVAGHKAEEFPTPQESLKDTDTKDLPASGGVGDLLNKDTSKDTTAAATPLVSSFADVTSNKDFPKPEKDTSAPTENELSDLPDVKDMLNQPSVRVPPVPKDQSFAKIAAKEIPPEKKPLSDRAQQVIKEQEKIEKDAGSTTEEEFPTLEQSALMSKEGASNEDKAVYTEISTLHQMDPLPTPKEEKKEAAPSSPKKSFADITSSNLDEAPPSATSRVTDKPVYNEDQVLMEKTKREQRKNLQTEQPNNEQLVEEEETVAKGVEPTKDQRDQEIEQSQVEARSREVVQEANAAVQGEPDENTFEEHLSVFDKRHTGKITIFNTIFALYHLGYPLLTIIPGAIMMHITLSPRTSPHRFPFIYRSPFDLILLPIYTANLNRALTNYTPALSQQNHEQVENMVKEYGRKSNEGLTFWEGLRAIRGYEKKNNMRWWQVCSWALHRIQWTLTYTMLHEPKKKIVTVPALLALSQAKNK